MQRFLAVLRLLALVKMGKLLELLVMSNQQLHMFVVLSLFSPISETTTAFKSFFSSYQRLDTGWSYIMGQFAQMTLPLADSAVLLVQLKDSNETHNITVCIQSVARYNSADIRTATLQVTFWKHFGAIHGLSLIS